VGFDTHGDKRDAAREKNAKKLQAGLQRIADKNPKLTSMQKDFRETWVKQLGTLGGGNHFIEVCLDEEQNVWVMLHSGSRGIGNVIGRYFIERARREMEKIDYKLPDRDLAWLAEGTPAFEEYIEAVHWAQDYAIENPARDDARGAEGDRAAPAAVPYRRRGRELPSQLCRARDSLRRERLRHPQRRHPRGRGRDGRDPRQHGRALLHRARQGQRAVAVLVRPRRRAPHEPHRGEEALLAPTSSARPRASSAARTRASWTRSPAPTSRSTR
jgi:hypothetical protein